VNDETDGFAAIEFLHRLADGDRRPGGEKKQRRHDHITPLTPSVPSAHRILPSAYFIARRAAFPSS
jgi:hypothetical protein